ncbi:MAG: hypothetical protein AAF449_24445, partial [Myxococcota bacterium]
DALFDRTYAPVEGSNRLEAAYLGSVGEILTDLHRYLLSADPRIAYAGPMDDQGYWPVGDGRASATINRVQQRENDRLSRRAVAKTTVWQSDRGDDGDLFYDVAVPIVVDGQSWGAFRVGYKFE